MQEELRTAKQVAAEFGITSRRVLALAKSRNVGRQVGTTWAFTLDEVEVMRPRKTGRPARKEVTE